MTSHNDRTITIGPGKESSIATRASDRLYTDGGVEQRTSSEHGYETSIDGLLSEARERLLILRRNNLLPLTASRTTRSALTLLERALERGGEPEWSVLDRHLGLAEDAAIGAVAAEIRCIQRLILGARDVQTWEGDV